MFFDRFVFLCKEKGVTQTKVVDDIGVTRGAIHKWRKGGTPHGKVLSAIADYFSVSTDYLLGNEKSAPTETSESALEFDFSNLMNADGTPADDEKKQIILRILSMGKDDTSKLMKWIDFMDELNQTK